MKAVLVRPHHPNSLHLQEIRTPELKPGTVLVKVLEISVDGTDFDINRGEYGEPPAGHAELVVTHENLGEVAQVGPGVEDVAPGDLVVATVRRPCPENCVACRAGEPDFCLTGHFLERGIKGLDGFAADYYREDPHYLIKVPPELRNVAVLLEPLSVAEKAIRQAFTAQRRLPWEPKRAFVTGAGPLGLLTAFVLRLEGLETHVLDIVASDHPKAQRVRELGARYVNSREVGLRALAERDGAPDLIVDATGVSALIFEALCALEANGIVVSLGLSPAHRTICLEGNPLNMDLVLHNKSLIGSVNAHMSDFEHGIEHMRQAAQRFPGWLESLISRKLPLEAFAQAFDKQPTDIKVVLQVSR